MAKGLFITFEGPEGSGKSTQLKKLKECLEAEGRTVRAFREPGGNLVSEAIREILLNNKHKGMAPETELLLFFAARSEIVRKQIKPALEEGHIVICDRYEDSTLAYQGYGREDLDLNKMKEMCDFVRGDAVPRLTFLLDIEPKAGMARGGRHDRMENESLSFHERVRNGFLDLANNEKSRFCVIDATLSKSEISDIIKTRVLHELG